MNTLLLIDDEENNLDALERIFRKSYETICFTEAKKALEYLKKNPVSVVISDQRMPKMTGTQFFKECQKISPDTVRLLLTGYTDLDSVIAAINDGHVYRYITKPWDNNELKQIVTQSFEHFELRQSLKLKNEQLKSAYEELKELDTAKSNFMYLINHELKTPLTSISSYLQLLQESNLDDEQKLFSKGIAEGYDRLENLINKTLLIMSAQTGNLKLNLQKQSIKDVYIQARAKIESFRKQQGVEFKENIKDFKAKIDSRLIEQVIEQLLHNSIKYAAKNSIVNIDISGAQICIINQAKSINEDKLSKFKQTFFIDENYKNHSNSTGLGLSIVNSILEIHQFPFEIKVDGKQVAAKIEFSS